MNRLLPRMSRRQFVQASPDILIMTDEFLEMLGIGPGPDFVQQRVERFLYIADQAQIEAGKPARCFSPAAHFNNCSPFGLKMFCGEISRPASQPLLLPHSRTSDQHTTPT